MVSADAMLLVANAIVPLRMLKYRVLGNERILKIPQVTSR